MKTNTNLKLITALLLVCLLPTTWVMAQEEVTITGTVTSEEDGTRLPGVNVLVKENSQGTITDIDGNYTITVPSRETTLVFSSVGFLSEAEPVGQRTTLDVVLSPDIKALEEIVVVGYGTQQEKDLTGSIASVSSQEIENQPAASIDNLLQGRAAGVQISQSTGAPGGRINIRIRGASSINAGNEPLFVIDGVPVYNDNKDPSGSSYGTFTPTNALTSINPNDIESIQILKDASATAIYGSRGSNGVVIITTKRGKGSDVSVNYSGYYGTQRVVRKLNLMNGPQHAAFLNDWAAANDLPEPFADPNSIGEGTDWQDVIFRSAPIQNHQVSLSSGGGDTKYFISANYFNQQGVVINSQLDRYAFRVNVDRNITDKLTFRQSLTYNRTINQAVPIRSVGAGNVRSAAEKAYVTSPTIPVYNEDGSYVETWYGASKPENPLAALRTTQSQVTGDNLLGNLSLEYEILDGLTFKTLLGVNLLNRTNEEYYPKETTYIGGILGGLGMLSNRRITNILNENTLRFQRLINEVHDIEVLGGFTWQTERDIGNSSQPSGFSDDRLGIDAVGGATGVPEVGSFNNEWSLASWLGRINYQYNNKYLLTATFRADGASRFGTGNKWGYFPSVALGYRLSEEAFIQNLNVFDDLKIRASYGLTGNQEIGSYQSLARLVTNAIYIFDNQLVSGAQQASLANQELRWEKSSQFDIGLDATLFNSRLRLVFDYYIKDTEDLLFTVNLPAYSGFSSALYNTGRLENEGVELGIGADILEGNFTWSTDVNVARNNAEITSLGRSGSTNLFEGNAPGAVLGYIYEGVFHDQAAIDAQSVQANVEPGDARYRDTNGDGELDADDRTVIGSPLPDYIFGFNNTFSYKGFTLSVFLQGEIGADISRIDLIHNPAEVSSNKSVDLVNRWTPSNTSSNIPRAGFSNWLSPSTYGYEDGSYVKLRNVQLGYTIPVTPAWMRNANIYLSGQNLATFTDYSGYDPEGGNGYPLARTLILGLNVGF